MARLVCCKVFDRLSKTAVSCVSQVSLAIKYAALTRRMNLANRLDALARQKAGLETAAEFEDELQQAGPHIREGHKSTHSNRPGRSGRTVSRPLEQGGEEEEMEEDEMEENGMEENGMDENLREESDTPSREGTRLSR